MKLLIRLFFPRQLLEHPQPPTGVLTPKLTGLVLALILDCCMVLFALSVVAYRVATAHAATFYVSQTSNASDTNVCLQAAPCRTIARGVLVAQSPGDVVFVRAGTYAESVTNWLWSGAPGRPITIRAYPGDTVIWTSRNTGSGSRDGAIAISSRSGTLLSYIRIEGFQFEGSKTRYTIRLQNEDSTQDSFPMGGFEIVNNTFVNNGKDVATG